MFFLRKNFIYLIIITLLLIILAYATNITSIPDSLILFQNEELNIKPIFGVKLEETVEVDAGILEDSNKTEEIDDIKNKEYHLSFMGVNLKTITANIVPSTKVVPLGSLLGLKLYTKGVLVVGMNEIKGEDEKVYKPYEEAGIEQGDSIIQINNEKVNTTEELVSCVSKCNGKNIDVTYIKDGNILETQIKPVKTAENTYKIGLWVRDAAAGVGTVTFYDASTNSFAALGHGIQDIDTQELVNISRGEFVTADILNIDKGEKDNPGKIEGTIDEGETIGNIYSNTEYGVYGVATNTSELNIYNNQEIEVATRREIKTGKASIICTLEDGIKREYEIEIEKIYINNNENNKSMLVKITDKELIQKTGGIIQGMSGAPIIQNGKLIGALTHVLVSNPEKRLWGICRYNDKRTKKCEIKNDLLKVIFLNWINMNNRMSYVIH